MTPSEVMLQIFSDLMPNSIIVADSASHIMIDRWYKIAWTSNGSIFVSNEREHRMVGIYTDLEVAAGAIEVDKLNYDARYL